MSPYLECESKPEPGAPRASGDEPAYNELASVLGACSPRERG